MINSSKSSQIQGGLLTTYITCNARQSFKINFAMLLKPCACANILFFGGWLCNSTTQKYDIFLLCVCEANTAQRMTVAKLLILGITREVNGRRRSSLPQTIPDHPMEGKPKYNKHKSQHVVAMKDFQSPHLILMQQMIIESQMSQWLNLELQLCCTST